METTMGMVAGVAWHVDPKLEVSNHVICGDHTKEVIFPMTMKFLIISQNINL